MGALEMILLAFGLVVFVGSFLIPARAKDGTEDKEKVSEEMIREMVGREVDDAKTRLNDIVDETVTYAMEKTERAMDRLTNEKMLAVNEYSDTVLEEINKNHKEVVFLYDMLNDKHENLKSTVSEAVKTASQVKQTVQDAEITVKEVQQKEVQQKEVSQKEVVQKEVVQKEFRPIMAERVEIAQGSGGETAAADGEDAKAEEALTGEAAKQPVPKKSTRKSRGGKGEASEKKAAAKAVAEGEVPEVTVSMNTTGRNGMRNSNERILELHKAGKSNMAIAKELGLGIGEVKLVIDLFEGV